MIKKRMMFHFVNLKITYHEYVKSIVLILIGVDVSFGGNTNRGFPSETVPSGEMLRASDPFLVVVVSTEFVPGLIRTIPLKTESG